MGGREGGEVTAARGHRRPGVARASGMPIAAPAVGLGPRLVPDQANTVKPTHPPPLNVSQAPVFVLALPLKLDQGTTKTGKVKKPLSLCPTLNEYNGMQGWVKARVREAVDHAIAETFSEGHVGAAFYFLCFAGTNSIKCTKRRRVVVTRHSSREPDELAVDVIGGKIPIDRLVKLGILAGDSRKWLDREARWEYAPPKAGKLVIEVYEVET